MQRQSVPIGDGGWRPVAAAVALGLAVVVLAGCKNQHPAATGKSTAAPMPLAGTPEPAAGPMHEAPAGPVREAPAVPMNEEAPAVPLGTVAGERFDVKDAVFMWRDHADDMTMILSDRTGLCGVLAAGAMPRDATLLMITFKHNEPGNQDAPFAPGSYPVRMEGKRAPQDVKRAVLLKMDGECRNTLEADAARASSGEVVIDAISPQKGGAASGRLDLTFGAAGKLAGTFAASFCELPDDAKFRGCQ